MLKLTKLFCCFFSLAFTAQNASAGDNREDFRLLALDLEAPGLEANLISTGTSGLKLRVGDTASFEVMGVGSRAVYVLNMDSVGDITLLFPNKFEPQLAQSVETLLIPSIGAPYVFEIVGNPGPEIVKIFVVEGDRAEFENLLTVNFAMGEAFPRAIVPVPITLSVLDDYLAGPNGQRVQSATIEYEIVK